MRRRVAALRAFVREARERLDSHGERLGALERDMIRVVTQVAALEERTEDLRQRIESPEAAGLLADDAARAEARSLVEEIRREHAQVRARISAAVRYEERLRALEARDG